MAGVTAITGITAVTAITVTGMEFVIYLQCELLKSDVI